MNLQFCGLLLLFVLAVKCDEWWNRLAKKQGPMVCVEERVLDKERYFSTPWTGGQLCGTETIVRFLCCHGYDRIPGERGCPLVLPLKSLAETARSAGAQKFMNHIEQSGLVPLLTNRGPYTLFAARDSVFNNLTPGQEKTINNSGQSRSQPPTLLFTVVEGHMPVKDLPDTLNTLFRQGSIIISKFTNGLVTANCVPIVTSDLEATNGLVHLTESLLLPSGYATVTDHLVRSPELTTMATAVFRAQLGNELKEKGPFTIFAPVDSAWEALTPSFIEDIMGDSNSIKALLQHHILDYVWCSPASAGGEVDLKTLEGSSVRLWCNESGQFIDEARLLETDHPTGNGFIHYIDTVLVPDKVLSLSDLLKSRGMTYFLKMIELGGLSAVLQRQGTYTVFAPTDEAFEDLSNETLTELLSQSSLARSVASFHIASGGHLTPNFIDGQSLGTLRGQHSPLRVKRHKELITFESSLVTAANIEARNGILHIIDRVLMTPSLPIDQALVERGNFSIFINLLNQTEPNLLTILSNISSTFTLFAPDDEALKAAPPGMVSRLLADPVLLFKMAAHHIVESYLVCGGMITGLTYQHYDINGHPLTLRKENGGSVTVANLATLEDNEITAINGIVHQVSRFLEV